MPTTIKTNSKTPFSSPTEPQGKRVGYKNTATDMGDGLIQNIKNKTFTDGVDTTFAPVSKRKITVTPYKSGRKDPSFTEENVNDKDSYPKNENKEKQGMRISTQKAEKESYEYNGKKEFAGIPAKEDTTYSDSLVPRYQQKYKVVTDTSYAPKIERGKTTGSPSIKLQERAPGLPGKNRLQRKY